MKFSYQTDEPLEAALQTAVVAYAWPKFVQADKGDESPIDVSGEFSMPVGHYLGVAPDDHILKVSVRLTGQEFGCEGGRHCGPLEQLCPQLAQSVQRELNGKPFSPEPVALRAVDELAATAKTRYSVKSTATVSVVSRKPAVDELPEKLAKLKQQLAEVEQQYVNSTANANRTCENSKVHAEQQRTMALESLKINYEQTKRELEGQISKMQQEIEAAAKGAEPPVS